MKNITLVLKLGAFLVFLTTFSRTSLFGQTITYDVVKGSKKIGRMSVKQENNADSTQFNIVSNVEFRLLLSFKIEYALQELFVNDELKNGFATSWLNGKVQKKSAINYGNPHYTLELNDKTSDVEEGKIIYSIPHLYFSEPLERNRVFSQQFGDYLEIRYKKDNTYELVSPDGKNIYTYENGICKEVKVFRTYANFSFIMVGIEPK